jgi:phosphotransferase system IIA component
VKAKSCEINHGSPARKLSLEIPHLPAWRFHKSLCGDGIALRDRDEHIVFSPFPHSNLTFLTRHSISLYNAEECSGYRLN